MSRENFNDWLTFLGNTLGFDISADELGMVNLEISDTITAYIKYQDNGDFIYFYYELGQVNSAALPKMAVRMLEANLFGQETGGGVLALEGSSQEAVFSYQAFLPLEVDRLTKILDNTINYADYWQQEIVRANQEAAEEEQAADQPPVMLMV